MNPFEMVVAIVAIGTVASIVRALLGVGRNRRGFPPMTMPGMADNGETERLREEVRGLKERVAVLERLITDQSSSLDREFEKLKQMD